MSRNVLIAGVAALALIGPVAAGPAVAGLASAGRSSAPITAASGSVGAVVGYSAPVPPPVDVVRPFDPPPDPYSAGHRGVDLLTPSGLPVLAAGAGRVSFAGAVGGRGLVVVVHADGVSTEYEPVAPLVRAGQPVARGQAIGRIRGRHGGCAVQRCLHWGAQRAGAYFDPMSLLRALGPVRLLPWPDP